MATANSSGPAAPDLSTPEPADAEQIRKRLAVRDLAELSGSAQALSC